MRTTLWNRSLMHILTVAFLVLNPTMAEAQRSTLRNARDEARVLGRQGLDAFRAGDFATAFSNLDSAFQLFPTPTLGLYSARSLERLGRWKQACERYRATAQTSEEVGESESYRRAQHEALIAAQRELIALSARSPILTIRVVANGRGSTAVHVDGESVSVDEPTQLDPGDHLIVAKQGTTERTERVTLHPSEEKSIAITLTLPDPSRPVTLSVPAAQQIPSWHKPVAIVSLSLGALSLVASGIGLWLANERLDACPDHVCRNAIDAQSFRGARTFSMISFYTGAALVVGGVSLLLLAPAAPNADRSIKAQIAFNHIELTGTF